VKLPSLDELEPGKRRTKSPPLFAKISQLRRLAFAINVLHPVSPMRSQRFRPAALTVITML
jgi:hypothetical protein